MRGRIAFVGVVLVSLCSVVPPAFAGDPPLDAAGFAGLCASGATTITGSVKVVGGSANFASCHITMSERAKLSFVDVTTGSTTGDFFIDGGPKSKVSFKDSYITAFNGSAAATLHISPGLGTSGGDGGAVKVDNTHLLAHTVLLDPSCDHNKGKVEVKGNSLEGIGGGDITLRTSVCDSDLKGGKVSVSDASLTTGNISLVTGSTGSTTVVRNNLSATTIQISGGKCKTKDNLLAGDPHDFPCT